MFTHRLFYVLIVVFLMITACAPQVPVTPESILAPAATEVSPASPTLPTTEDSPAAEASPLEFRGHQRDVWGVDFSPDGKYLATGSSDKTARLWDVATGEEISVFSGHTGEVGGVAFSPDGKYLLTGSVDTTARLWDVATGETVQTFSGHTSGVEVGGFSPDGKYMVTAGAFDLTGRVWDVASGETLHVLTGHSELVIRAAYSPDGKYVLTASVDGTARLWDTATGEEVRVLEHPNVPGAIAFSPDGKSVATGGEDNVTRLWDVASGELIDSFTEHTSFVQGVSFSPDGRYLLTGSDDKTARLWDLSTGETIRVFADHRGAVQMVTFSPDGNLIATSSNDSVARVWDLQASPEMTGPSDTVTLRLAVADQGGRPSEPYVFEFIEQVKTLSNGNLIIEPIWDAGASTDAGFEVGVVQLVRAGEAELGLTGSRAFDMEGITSFQALQAPFLITNDALSEAVAASDIGTHMLESLSSAEMVGLTLWPEDLRHPFSIIPDKPILSPKDFEGATVRVVPSEISHLLIETLGGKPIFDDRDYQAAESGLRQGSSLTATPTATGNVIFFPKFQVLFANGAAFEKLSDAQQTVIREAVAATQAKAIAEHPREVDAAAAWCADGGTVVMASNEQVAAFETAAQPVFARIEQHPMNAELIALIRELKAKTAPAPGADACGPIGLPIPQPTESPLRWSEGLPPNGVWQAEITTDDFVRMGLLRSVAETEWAGLYTITFQDGTYFMEWQGEQGKFGKCQANYEVVGDIVRLTYYQTTGHECEDAIEDIQWRLDNEQLHLHLVAANGPLMEPKAFFEAKPWQKVEEWTTGLLPNGVWQVELTAEDIAQFGVLQSTADEMAGTYTWTFQDGNARIEINGPKITVSCMVVATVIEDTVRLQNVGSSTCDGDAYDEVQWRLDDEGLHFHLVAPQSTELKATYEAKSWQKISDP